MRDEPGHLPWDRLVRLSAPRLIVYRDGTILFRDDRRSDQDRLGDPERWREWRVPPDRLRSVEELARRSGFLSAASDELKDSGRQISAAGGLWIGMAAGERFQVAVIDTPNCPSESPIAGTLNRAAAELRAELLSLVPARSLRFEPAAIRVGGVRRAPGGSPARVTAWPASRLPNLEAGGGPLTRFDGAEARAIVRALASPTLFRDGDMLFEAEWAPDFPLPGPTRFVVPAGPRSDGTWPDEAESSLTPALTLRSHPGPVCAMAWSPDGQELAAAAPRYWPLRIWNATTGQLRAETEPVSDPIQCLDWEPRGRRLAAMGSSPALLDPSSAEIPAALEGDAGEAQAAAWNRDGDRVAFARPLLTLDAEGRSRWTAPHGERVTGIAWSPDGRSLAAVDADGAVRLWRERSTEPPTLIRRGIPSAPFASAEDRHGIHYPVCWSPSGKELAVPGVRDGTVRLLDVASRSATRVLRFDGPTVSSLSWHRGGRLLAAISGTALRVWDLRSGRVRVVEVGADLFAGSWSPDGRRYAAGAADGRVRIWHTRDLAP